MSAALNHRLVENSNVEEILFLYRRDVSAYAMSMVTASLTKEWHGASSSPIGDMPIKRLLQTAERQIMEIPFNATLVKSASAVPITCVCYEDLYGSNGSDFQNKAAYRAFSALGITDIEFIEESVKNMLSPKKKYKTDTYYKEIFENYETARNQLKELVGYFEACPMELPETIFENQKIGSR